MHNYPYKLHIKCTSTTIFGIILLWLSGNLGKYCWGLFLFCRFFWQGWVDFGRSRLDGCDRVGVIVGWVLGLVIVSVGVDIHQFCYSDTVSN